MVAFGVSLRHLSKEGLSGGIGGGPRAQFSIVLVVVDFVGLNVESCRLWTAALAAPKLVVFLSNCCRS
jgi:hypothetical protein